MRRSDTVVEDRDRPLTDTDPNDEQLARRAQAGCEHSFEQLVRRYQAPLLQFLLARTRDRADAEDLFQDTFVRAYVNLSRYNPQKRFRTWLYTIAFRLTVSRHRTARLSVAGDDVAQLRAPGEQPLERMARHETRGLLWRIAREQLTDTQYTILWLHCVERMPLTEVGRVMGRSSNSARAALSRARKTLLPHLEAARIAPVFSAASNRVMITIPDSCGTAP